MSKPDVPLVAEVLGKLAHERWAIDVPHVDVVAHLDAVLFGEKNVWAAFEMGLGTHDEVANAVVDRFCTWLGHRTGKPIRQIPDISDRDMDGVKDALFKSQR